MSPSSFEWGQALSRNLETVFSGRVPRHTSQSEIGFRALQIKAVTRPLHASTLIQTQTLKTAFLFAGDDITLKR